VKEQEEERQRRCMKRRRCRSFRKRRRSRRYRRRSKTRRRRSSRRNRWCRMSRRRRKRDRRERSKVSVKDIDINGVNFDNEVLLFKTLCFCNKGVFYEALFKLPSLYMAYLHSCLEFWTVPCL